MLRSSLGFHTITLYIHILFKIILLSYFIHTIDLILLWLSLYINSVLLFNIIYYLIFIYEKQYTTDDTWSQ